MRMIRSIEKISILSGRSSEGCRQYRVSSLDASASLKSSTFLIEAT